VETALDIGAPTVGVTAGVIFSAKLDREKASAIGWFMGSILGAATYGTYRAGLPLEFPLSVGGTAAGVLVYPVKNLVSGSVEGYSNTRKYLGERRQRREKNNTKL